MAAHAAPTVEDERAAVSTVLLHVVVEHVVAPERFAQAVDVLACQVLLPVYPPEVHALFFAFTEDMGEHRAVEQRVLQHPRHAVGTRHVQVGGNLGKMVLIRGHAVGGMQVQCHFQTLHVHPAYQAFGIRDEVLVPCPACPTVQVPVHVEDHHVNGYVVLFDFGYKVHEVLLRVALVLAVPVAQGIQRGHRLPTGNLDVVADGFLVLMAVAHEVPVVGIRVGKFRHPGNAIYGLFKSESRGTVATLRLGRLVNNRPSGPRQDAKLQVRALVVATAGVQRALRATKVQRVVLAGIPRHLATVQLHGDAQRGGRLQGGIDGRPLSVAQGEGIGLYVEVTAFLTGGKLGYGQLAVDDGKRGTVLKL